MKLSDAPPGRYVIERVRDERLKELGFIPGRRVEVVVNRGHMVILLENEKFAIDRELAEGVEVG